MPQENKINSVTSSVDTGTSIKFIGESDSSGNNLRIEDGKLSGTIVGSVMKDFTGRVDDVTLELSNVPIDGVGGGDKVYEVVQIVTASLKFGAPYWKELYSETNHKGYAFVYSCNFDDGYKSTNLNALTGGRKIVGVYALKKDTSGNTIAGFSGVSVDVNYPVSSDVMRLCNLLSIPTSDYSKVTAGQIAGMLQNNSTFDTTTGVDLYAIVEG